MAAAGPLPALWLEPIKQDGGVLAFVSGALVFCVWVLVPLMDWRIVSKLVPNGARGSVLALMFSALAALLLIVDPVRAGAVFFVALAAVSAVGLIAVGASKSVVGGQRAFRTAVGLSALIGVTGWWILVT